MLVVTPRAGVWIEISLLVFWAWRLAVTPRAGVWIEMCPAVWRGCCDWSLPVRECGLKFVELKKRLLALAVTPRAGVWIEIICISDSARPGPSHSPCGSVD